MSETEDATAWLDRAAAQAQESIDAMYTEAREAIHAEESDEEPTERPAGSGGGQVGARGTEAGSG
jgi:hypothetical protein